jgi:hypothetical protein
VVDRGSTDLVRGLFSNEEPVVARGVGEGPQDGRAGCSRTGFAVKINSASNDRSWSRIRVNVVSLCTNGIGLRTGAGVPLNAPPEGGEGEGEKMGHGTNRGTGRQVSLAAASHRAVWSLPYYENRKEHSSTRSDTPRHV